MKKQPAFAKLGEKIKFLDQFGEEIEFEIEGDKTYRTYLGSFLTLLVFVTTLTYTV